MNIFHQNLSVSLWANLSHSNNETGRDDQPSTPSIRALAVWYAVLMTVSLAGAANNLLLFVVICRSKTLRGGAGFLIAHIVLIYVVLCLLLLPLSYTAILIRGHGPAWQLSPYFCRFVQASIGAAMIISNWLDVLLAVNRLVAICIPLRYRAFSQRRNTLAILAVLWVFAVTTTGLSGIFEIGGRYITSPAGQCVFVGRDAFASFQYIFSSFVPTAIVGIIAVLIIARTASRSVHSRVEIDVLRLGPRDRSQQYRLGPQAQRRLGLAKMLFVSFLLSFLTGLPMMIIMNSYPQLLQRELMATLWLRIFGVAPFTLNPFVFYAMNKDFRKGLLALFDSRPSTDTASVLLETNGKTFGRSLEMKTISMKSRLVTLDLEGSSETVLTV